LQLGGVSSGLDIPNICTEADWLEDKGYNTHVYQMKKTYKSPHQPDARQRGHDFYSWRKKSFAKTVGTEQLICAARFLPLGDSAEPPLKTFAFLYKNRGKSSEVSLMVPKPKHRAVANLVAEIF